MSFAQGLHDKGRPLCRGEIVSTSSCNFGLAPVVIPQIQAEVGDEAP
jgi:2-keto-4-pentenoate hydratase